MKKALLIVHLSSLDAYADQKGVEEAQALAGRMQKAILEHEGPVYIVDQRWPFVEPYSKPRYDLVHSVQLARDIEWRHWEETWERWDHFLGRLQIEMKQVGVKDVVLAGIWYDPAGQLGCVTESLPSLKKMFRTTIDPEIVGCVPGSG